MSVKEAIGKGVMARDENNQKVGLPFRVAARKLLQQFGVNVTTITS